jgi:ABC-2 type transport system ATP-binding protein
MLEARRLTKVYSRVRAVSEVSFTIRPGEVLGYLGPNGSGKSTTVNMLTGLIEPTAGEILLDGRAIKDDWIAYKRRLGYVPEEPHVYPYLAGREYLQLIARLRELPQAPSEKRIDDLLHLFGLHPHRYSPISAYSKGMKQKILLAGALLHNPDVLVLDEPFSGLDVTSALVFRNLIQELARIGKVLFYSSHVLEVVEKLCSRVIILRKGQVVADDSVSRLRDLMNLPSLEDVFAQLALQEDAGQVARDIVDAIRC